MKQPKNFKGLSLHEKKSEILLDYTDNFGRIRSMLIVEREQRTNFR